MNQWINKYKNVWATEEISEHRRDWVLIFIFIS